MTTKVTVDAHAGWDVEVVEEVKTVEGVQERTTVVAKNTVKDFYIHSGLALKSVKELQVTP